MTQLVANMISTMHSLLPYFMMLNVCIFSQLYASIDMSQILSANLSNQMGEAEKKIVVITNQIRKEFLQKGSSIGPGRQEFCSISFEDNYCRHKATEVQQIEKNTIVRTLSWGFVDEDLEDNSTFDTVTADKVTFNHHLCLEVHFKDMSEIKNASPIFANKTVILCALTRNGSELIDLELVSHDELHAKNMEGSSGWKCINPHNDLNNGGSAFGYTQSNGRLNKTKITGTDYLDNCLRDPINIVE